MSTGYKIVAATLFGLGFLLTGGKAWVFANWRAWKGCAGYAIGALGQLAMFVWTLAQ